MRLLSSPRRLTVIFAVVLAPLLAGQIGGTLRGRVFDVSGAVAPKATIMVLNSRTGSTLTTSTRDDGSYSLNVINTGRYEVTCELPGFWPESRILWLASSGEVETDFVLRPAATHGRGDVIIVGLKPGEPPGEIRGLVLREGLGWPIGKANVTARHLRTGGTRSVKTAPDGTFLINHLVEGKYELKAEAENRLPEYRSATVEYAVQPDVTFRLETGDASPR